MTFPHLGGVKSHSAKLVSPMAGKKRSFFFRPEVGDEVLVAFEQNDSSFPYILGALWSQADAPPPSDSSAKDNNHRFIHSRSGHIIRFDDTKGEEATVLGAHSKAAPHVRERLFWVANANSERDSRKARSETGRASSIPTIWESAQIFETGQRGVDELVARRVTQRVSSYADAYGLLHGIPARVVRLRGYGNAIVPQVAAEFIQAYREVI